MSERNAPPTSVALVSRRRVWMGVDGGYTPRMGLVETEVVRLVWYSGLAAAGQAVSTVLH